jgi:hypothetical protein
MFRIKTIRDNSVGIATDYELDGPSSILRDERFFYSSQRSRAALGPTQTSYSMGTGGSFPGGKAAGT